MVNNWPLTRLSMWSGPRNISTAMMRAFGNRPDCSAIDEPFYAYYLKTTGLQHPMRDAILETQPHRWQDVQSQIDAPRPQGTEVLYLKHMTQHMLPHIDLSQMASHAHCFLIRDPRLVIASFAEKWDQVDADATGFRQQLKLFEYFSKHAKIKPVIVEGEDIQKAPENMLQKLCKACGIDFYDHMLSWPSGRRPEDGVWGSHWYNAVEASTGFADYVYKDVHLTKEQAALAKELEPIYLELKSEKLAL